MILFCSTALRILADKLTLKPIIIELLVDANLISLPEISPDSADNIFI